MAKEIISPPGLSEPPAPYARAVKVPARGHLIFLSGVVSSDAENNLIHGHDILLQTRQTVKNLIDILAAAGAKPADVVKTTTFIDSRAMKDFFNTQAFREALTPFDRPCDSLIGVSSLVASDKGQLIEIDAIAVIND